jgi:ADP-heptose:LPS heptosyltransferase
VRDTAINRFIKRSELAARRGIIAIMNRRKQQHVTSFPLSLPEAPTILFLRQDRYGDAIISTPILTEIARKYPQAKLMMLLGENNKDIASLLAVTCETFIYKKKLLEDIRMLRALRDRKIDVLVDMTDNASATSTIVAAMVSARFSVGIEKENAESYNVLVKRLDRGKYHVSRRIAELLRPFGIDPETVSLRPVLRTPDIRKVPGRVALNISSREPSRYLPIEVNARIAELLSQEAECTEVMVFGQPSHAADLGKIVALAANEKVKAPPPMKSFAEFVSTIGTCEYIVSPDTAAVHIGSAFSTPMVVYYNISPPTLHYWTPIDVPYEMIVKESLQTLTAEEVLEAFGKLMAKVNKHEEAVLV